MKIQKSTRHQKIIGDTGENLVCNWLSRSGFEVSIIDHTGIDIVAYYPATGRRLGITVKSRTRSEGRETVAVNIIPSQGGEDEREKIQSACTAFSAEPWIAVYVETKDKADLFLTSLAHYENLYHSNKSRGLVWSMSPSALKRYDADPEVRHVHFTFSDANWNWGGE